jgi:carboxylesterase type B
MCLGSSLPIIALYGQPHQISHVNPWGSILQHYRNKTNYHSSGSRWKLQGSPHCKEIPVQMAMLKGLIKIALKTVKKVKVTSTSVLTCMIPHIVLFDYQSAKWTASKAWNAFRHKEERLLVYHKSSSCVLIPVVEIRVNFMIIPVKFQQKEICSLLQQA